MSAEEKFKSAVNIIKHLPKEGPLQTPSRVKLKFYSLYKQATEGPNTTSKPRIWDIINRSKWEAWNGLSNMSREEAMNNYVAEFVKVVNNLFEANDAQRMSKKELDDFYASIPMDDLEFLVGPVKRHLQPLSENEAIDCESAPPSSQNEERNDDLTSEDDDHFLDSHEEPEYFRRSKENIASVNANRSEYEDEGSVCIRQLVRNLEKDIQDMRSQIAILEQRVPGCADRSLQRRRRNGVPPLPLIFFIMSWPIFVQFFFTWLKRKQSS